MRSVLITRLRKGHVVARPKDLSLWCTKGFRVRGSGDQHPCCGNIGAVAPAPCSFFPKNVLNPDASDRVKLRKLAHPRGSGVGRERVTSCRPIFPDEDGGGFAGLLAIGETSVFHPVPRALDPRCLPLLVEPLGSPHRQTLPDRPKGFSSPSPRWRARIFARTGVESVRGCPRMFQEPRSRNGVKKRAKTRSLFSFVRKRCQHSRTTRESTPGSLRSHPHSSFPSRRPRTASAACRSESPSRNGIAQTHAKRQGASAGWPRRGYRSRKGSSSERLPNASRHGKAHGLRNELYPSSDPT